MPPRTPLTDRERQVLEAVIQAYIESAEPAASRLIARDYRLGVSPATVRQTMSDLEDKGYLFHPHTSAGRIPTDLGYREYVDSMLRTARLDPGVERTLREELPRSTGTLEEILRRTAQVLGVLAQELGVAVAPQLDAVILERLELVPIASDRLLLVFNLRSGVVRTIFVQVPGHVAPGSAEAVGRILNERLGGLSLAEIRSTLPERLRDASPGGAGGHELLHIFLEQGEDIFDLANTERELLLGSARPLAEQPEFSSSNERLRRLLDLTERHDPLRRALAQHTHRGVRVTIGTEHDDPSLADFTLVTASYQVGGLSGVIGVLGPTRMPYAKVVSLVTHTSQLVEDLLE